MKHVVFVALLAAAFGMPLGNAGARPPHPPTLLTSAEVIERMARCPLWGKADMGQTARDVG